MLASRHWMLVICITMLNIALTYPAFAKSAILEQLKFDTNPAPDVAPVKITATLYLPQSDKSVAAMVIINSSGGVLDQIEGHYARSISQNGIAALVVDSFRPRKVLNTNENQELVNSWVMENDAFAALAELKKDKRIDPTRIGIMGVSKGGLVAQNSAMMVRRELRRTGSLAFALHVPIVPDCVGQFRNAATTGRPIFYMVAELDDLTPAKPCVEYADRMKAAGNSRVSIKIYPGQHHAWELSGPVIHMKKSENYSACAAMIEDNGDRTMKANNKSIGGWNVGKWMKQNCITRGAHVGGGTEKQKKQATDDLIAFLKQNGF
ncbi:dienelactone hydrolase family protein [Bradyrhizobium sp. AUGA SZCCT0240]|uniref:dienelactone hydrolase family protein n=1 Tax=unclassified Bradyrhizobium TaxID=2631580 RepID=UPI001BA90C71|nr:MULTISPECIES: dienelactone hydrolase family protein [unclassified Bradyrhizobium]MBR1198770.1 dienelactone hydrolase family protein [Bradyrhizobium sp. AUGA SZCCT0158]MBR1240961.1 dienelactone hydrolase family protein [Bradyrhizobium sp. AUGA SZCCT0274]MBR1255981.1 dienelactone hydrolase family protein [Bradyrhizobium sp. AUGA SZCCT0240]